MNLVKKEFEKLETAVYEQCTDIQDIPVEHTFIEGVYARHGKLEAGRIYVGHEHKLECLNILTHGVILLKNSMDDEGIRIEAPYTFVTKPGNRKIGYCLEDGYMYNIFRTDETDIDKLEDEVLATKSEAYLKYKEDSWSEYQQQLG